MGYPDASAYTSDRLFDSKIKPNFVVEDLKCNGHERNIKDCDFKMRNNLNSIKSNVKVAGVVCSDRNF